MRNLKRWGINIEAIIKIVTLLGFALLFYSVIQSGNARFYVHPRIIPYMVFGIAAFILISFFISDEIFRPKRKNTRIGRYLIFIIPLILAFSIPPKTLDTDSMALNSLNALAESDDTTFDEDYNGGTDKYPNEERNGDNVDNENNLNNEKSTTDSTKGLTMQGDTIIMGDENFIPWIEELYANLGKYEGKNIEVVGFVFKDKEFKENEFVPARFTMSCCAADMEPVGVLCSFSQTEKLKKDSWVKVTGEVKRGEFKGQKMPFIMADTVLPTAKPQNDIVY